MVPEQLGGLGHPGGGSEVVAGVKVIALTFQYWNHWHGHTSTFKLNISPDNISLGLLFCVLSLPSSYSHCFHEVNYRLHLISHHALNNG